MKSIKQQITEAKQEKTEREKELWFVDYCNNCKTGLASKNDVPCHHPYYCWHEGEAAIVQAEIVRIDEYRRLHGTSLHRCIGNIKILEKDNIS